MARVRSRRSRLGASPAITYVEELELVMGRPHPRHGSVFTSETHRRVAERALADLRELRADCTSRLVEAFVRRAYSKAGSAWGAGDLDDWNYGRATHSLWMAGYTFEAWIRAGRPDL